MQLINRVRSFMSGTPFVHEAAELFVTHVSATTSLRNAKNHRANVKQFVLEHGAKLICDLTPSMGDLWVILLKNKGYKKTTIHGRVVSLRYFERFISERWPDQYKPFAGHLKSRRPKPVPGQKLPEKGAVKLCLDVAYRLLKSDEMRKVRAATIYLWTLTTGTRRAETAALEIEYMGLNKPTFSTPDGDNIYEATLPSAKSSEDYFDTVDYDEEMAGILKDWLKIRPVGDLTGAKHPHLFVGASHCGRCRLDKGITAVCAICKNHGRPITTSGIRFDFEVISKLAGVWVTPHQIRHYFGQLITDRTNLEIARQRLRHRHIETTALYYSHQDKERRKLSVVSANPRTP